MTAIGLRLHPLHFEPKTARPQQMTWDAPGSQEERLGALTAKATESLELCEPSLPEGEVCVLRTDDCLVMRSPGVKDILVPMLHTEVGFATSGQISVVALARPGGKRWASEGDDRQVISHVVWFIVSQDGSVGLRALLRTLGAGGAVRGDFSECFGRPSSNIGSGESATVYKVAELSGNRAELAAKALSAGSMREMTAAQAEVELLSRVQGHPNVVRLHGTFVCPAWTAQEDEGQEPSGAGEAEPKTRLVVVMQFCAGGSLFDRVHSEGTYPETEALEITSGVLSALAHVHERGLVHRDVKAENVLRGPEGRPILADFGIAAWLSDDRAMLGRCGTPGYAAPEMLTKDASYGKKVDVFSTGVLLFLLIFGRTPFDKKGFLRDQALLAEALKKLAEKERGLRQTADRAVEKELEGTVEESKRKLEAFLKTPDGQEYLAARTKSYIDLNPGLAEKAALREAREDLARASEARLREQAQATAVQGVQGSLQTVQLERLKVARELIQLQRRCQSLLSKGDVPSVALRGFDMQLVDRLTSEAWYTKAREMAARVLGTRGPSPPPAAAAGHRTG